MTILGGSVGVFHGRKMTEIADLAVKTGVPLVALMESPGARVQEAISEVIGPPNIFYQNVRASGVVPQIAVVLGNTAGMVIYSAALMDFIFMVDKQAHQDEKRDQGLAGWGHQGHSRSNRPNSGQGQRPLDV